MDNFAGAIMHELKLWDLYYVPYFFSAITIFTAVQKFVVVRSNNQKNIPPCSTGLEL